MGGQRVLGGLERLGLLLEGFQPIALCLGLDALLDSGLGLNRGLLPAALDLRGTLPPGVAAPRGPRAAAPRAARLALRSAFSPRASAPGARSAAGPPPSSTRSAASRLTT